MTQITHVSMAPVATDHSPTVLPFGQDRAAARRGVTAVQVLHVVNGEHYSGAERVQDLLAAGLPQEGFEVGFACVKPGRFPELRKCRTAPLFEVPMRSRWDLRAALRVIRIVRSGDYRIVHAHTPRSAMLGRIVSRVTRVPFVYHVHSPTSRDTTHRLRNWINSATEWWSLRGRCALIAVSESLREHLRRSGFPADSISVVPNGVPYAPVQRGPHRPGLEWTVGSVALFRPRKGLEILLEAMAQLRQRGLLFRLRAVGPFETADYETHIRQHAEQLGLLDAIDWVGFRDDVPAELARMDLLVLPSLFGEGLPMVVLEAMAAGVPVIATRVEGVPEAIDDGLHGLLAHPGDPRDLASCLERVIRGEADWGALRQNALARHAAQFSDRSMAAGVARVYRRVLA